MNAERWEHVKKLFGAALEREANQRGTFLREACREDHALRLEVESLLSAYRATESLEQRSNAASAFDSSEEVPLSGQRIGAYQVIHEIGRGGMAVVYLAIRADDAYRKRVAIKLVKDCAEIREIRSRFRNERQTLAALDHPNIVKLLDGGTTQDGAPYLVMDYVEGTPITEYSDLHQLSIAERLELFCIVCGAVHYAHQNLVIHRDLKPGNILVTAEGIPKLLDFGIAKLLNPEFSSDTLLLTRTDQRLMTPEYASPEQVLGQPVTTSTDVYSLGVLLYELLTGHRPYLLQGQTLHEIEHVICVEEPQKPSTVVTSAPGARALEGTTRSTLDPKGPRQSREAQSEKLRRRLVGDLDNIVLMALRKEPQRRYASAEQFAQDIQRHLDGLPVTARPATMRYRASKFIHRHTAAVSFAAAVLLMLITGIIVTAREARIANTERIRAERRFNDLRQLANTFLFEFHDSIKDLPGATPARTLVVRKAQEYLDRLSKEASGDPSLQGELGEAYLRLAAVQGNPYTPNLGDTAGALQSYRKALSIAATLERDNPKSVAAERLLARTEKGMGEVLASSGEAVAAVEYFRKSIKLLERVADVQKSDTSALLEVAATYSSLGEALDSPNVLNIGDKAAALESYEKSSAIYRRLAEMEPNNPRVLSALAIAETEIGDSRENNGALTQALSYFENAYEIYEELVRVNPANFRYRKNLSAIRDRQAMIRAETGDKAGAIQDMRKALAIDEELSATDPQNMNIRELLWLGYNHLGETLADTGHEVEALPYFHKALTVMQDLASRNPENLQLQAKLSDSFLDLGLLLVKQRNITQGAPMISRGLGISKKLADRPDATATDLHRHAKALLNCKPRSPCEPAAALSYARRAVDMTKAGDPAYLDSLAMAYYKAGDSSKALEIEQRVLLLLPPANLEQATSESRKAYEANLAKFKRTKR